MIGAVFSQREVAAGKRGFPAKVLTPRIAEHFIGRCGDGLLRSVRDFAADSQLWETAPRRRCAALLR